MIRYVCPVCFVCTGTLEDSRNFETYRRCPKHRAEEISRAHASELPAPNEPPRPSGFDGLSLEYRKPQRNSCRYPLTHRQAERRQEMDDECDEAARLMTGEDQ